MIFYSSDLNLNLTQFGMDLPLYCDRSQQVIDDLFSYEPYLRQHAKWLTIPELRFLTEEDFLKVHTKEYWQALHSADPLAEISRCYEFLNYGFSQDKQIRPWRDLVEVMKKHCQGTYEASRYALGHGWSYFLGGGMHHAVDTEGRGFCLLNDIVITAKKILSEGQVEGIVLIDVDAHKGDGCSYLLDQDPRIFSLDLHLADTWPLTAIEEGKWSSSSSTMDIKLFRDDSPEYYLGQLKSGLEAIYPNFKDRKVLVMVVDGADPYEHDALASSADLKLPLEIMLRRDKIIHQFFRSRQIPVVYTMGGGYGMESYKVYAQFLRYLIKQEFQLS